MRATIDAIDAVMAGFNSTLPRPGASILGRFHRDSGTGVISFDTGGSWVEIARMPHAAAHAPGGADPVVKTFQIAHNILVPGPVAVPSGQLDVIPPIAVPVVAGQTTKVVRVRYRLNNGQAGQTVTFAVQRNGANLTGYDALTTPASTNWAETDAADIALANNDSLQVVVTSVVGSPSNLSVALVLEHAV